MDEAAWLASEDPAAMLEHVRDKVGNRKLRLWVEANRCNACESTWFMDWSWAAKAAYQAGASCSTPQRKAMLLREIVGNPFRPRHIWSAAVDRPLSAAPYADNLLLPRAWLSWQDGLVPRLAQAAHDERKRNCEACKGRGQIWYDIYHLPCKTCHGTGRIDDGTLDSSRLLVLADALEEAGCAEEELLRHLRGQGSPHVRGCWALDLLLGRD